MPKANEPAQRDSPDAAQVSADLLTNKAMLFDSLLAHHPQIELDTFQIARGVNISRLLLMTAADAVLRPHGLSWSKLFIMLWLRAAHDAGNAGLAPSALSDGMDLTRNTVSALLAGLEDQGYISRALDTADKRRFVMQLTPAGAAITHTCAEALFANLNTLIQHIDQPQREALLAGLTQLQSALWCSMQDEHTTR